MSSITASRVSSDLHRSGNDYRKGDREKLYDEADRRLLKPLKLSDTIPQDGPRLKRVVQGYAGDKNPFGGKDEMIRDGQFVINPQFEWTGGGYL